MAEPTLGIGGAKTHKMITEEHPNPGERKAIISAIERILTLGGVMRLVLEYGKPFRVSRMVRLADMPEAPQELVDDDLYSAARNAEMEEFLVPMEKTWGAHETLFYMFDVLTRRRLKPKAILVHQYMELKSWLRVNAHQDISEVYGVSVRPQKEIPDDTFLVVATTWDDLDTVTFSLRFVMDLPKRKT
jgi:hypothetical protein